MLQASLVQNKKGQAGDNIVTDAVNGKPV